MHRTTVVGALLGSLLLFPGAALAQRADWTDWARVRGVAPGDKVIVTTTDHPSREYRMAFADETQLVLAQAVGHMSARTLEAMSIVGPNWPGVLGGRVMKFGDVQISSGGIQESGARVAILEVVSRGAVVEVRRPQAADLAATLWTVAGAGALLASGNRGFVEESRRREGLPPSGAPFPTPRQTNNWPEGARNIVYIRPGGPFLALDDAAWERQLRGVPASLRGKGHGGL